MGRPKGPSYDPTVKRLAMMTEDHPYDYAAFEGVIPEGNYGAGNVIIWDQGTWEFIEPGDDPVKALQQGKLTFRLYGKKMFGEWALVKIRGRSPKGNEWLLLKHRDQYANPNVDVTEVAPRSVVPESHRRGNRRRQHLDQQSKSDAWTRRADAGQPAGRAAGESDRYEEACEGSSSCSALSSSFFSDAKLARRIASLSSTHSTSSTSLSCGLSSPPVYVIR